MTGNESPIKETKIELADGNLFVTEIFSCEGNGSRITTFRSEWKAH